MFKAYGDLVQLQKETVGATFIMGFSTKSQKHYVVFNLKAKRFEANDPVTVLNMAALWIKDTRIRNEKSNYPVYTLHKPY